MIDESPPQQAAEADWKFETDGVALDPRSALEVLTNLNERVSEGRVGDLQPVATGFVPFDKAIGGGLRSGELMLIGGAQGSGKTTLALQMARNMAASGQATVLYVCFEHEEDYLVQRMIAMESALSTLPKKTGAVKIQDVRQEVLSTFEAAAEAGQVAKLGANPRLRPSLERIARYGNSMYLMRGTATASTIDNLRALVDTKRGDDERRLVLFVDYLQKVPVIPEPADETEKVTRVVNGLKDIALASEIGVVAIVAADREGLKAKRLRNHHLRGSSAINYEADIILILNDKYNIVAKVNIEFNPYQAQRYRDWVVATVEKNRGGQDNIDLEWQKLFQYSCFDPNGRITAEKLIEERLYTE
ncbi:MAG TPA: DnaB-like helicase C-terminal domain-containing protein [Candidatus Limnocylindria bacterium]|nr:DnaB-like helicase C-terminal domain-containing protein [Candidatus Limnocylindria bacterium]HJT63663.1 DnaB-like helicase C-terminal domain-containing protein [Candidatus Limnocylindria bacterium]